MSKIRKSARGEQCQVRIPKVCNRNPETVVLAHKNGAGLALKALDCEAAYACSACHDVYDKRARLPVGTSYPEVEKAFEDGATRTRRLLVEKGLIVLK